MKLGVLSKIGQQDYKLLKFNIMKLFKMMLFIIALSITGNTFAKTHFIVDMIKLKQKTDITTYIDRLEEIAKFHHGVLSVNPIVINGQIETEVTPEYTTAFNYDYILIIRFENRKNAKNYSKDTRTLDNFTHLSARITKQSVFLSKNMMALPGMPDFPEINNELIRPAPSFILVNAIKMKKTPGSIMKMMKYFKRNYPAITASGTSYFSTLKVAKVLKGDFDFQMLFLTEWASMDAFQELHRSPSFKENVHLRNTSFTGFTEGKGVITTK